MYYPGCGERNTTLWGSSAGAAQSTVAKTGLMQSYAVRPLSGVVAMASAIACSHTVCFSFLVCCVVWRRQPVTALSQKWEKRVNIVPLSLSCSNCYLTLHSLKCSRNLAISTCVAVPTAFFTLAVMSFLCIFRTALATGCAKHWAATAKQSQCQRHGGTQQTMKHHGGGGGARMPATEGGGGAARTLLQRVYPGPEPGQANTVPWPRPEPAKHVLL